jgi:hypothetical protein
MKNQEKILNKKKIFKLFVRAVFNLISLMGLALFSVIFYSLMGAILEADISIFKIMINLIIMSFAAGFSLLIFSFYYFTYEKKITKNVIGLLMLPILIAAHILITILFGANSMSNPPPEIVMYLKSVCIYLVELCLIIKLIKGENKKIERMFEKKEKFINRAMYFSAIISIVLLFYR